MMERRGRAYVGVNWAGQQVVPADAAARAGRVRLVGRDAELAELLHALTRAIHGSGSTALIIGEAGIDRSETTTAPPSSSAPRRIRAHRVRSAGVAPSESR